MRTDENIIDKEALNRLQDRLKRGIPKWEQAAFIEQVVPQLVAKLQEYLRLQPKN